jgi:hypothetical protein
MNSIRFPVPRGAWCLAVALFATMAARAAVPSMIPELFADEYQDVGPQYLLSAARGQPVELWSELEITRSSNATLVEANPTASTITSAQAGGTWHFAPRARWGGQMALETGFRVQTYRYGLLADPKRLINFLEIDRNNFDLIGAHLGASWRRDGWLVLTALRGASLRNRGNDRVFYQEAVLDWQVYRSWRLGARGALTVGWDGAVRATQTDSFGLLARGWNNRTDLGLLAAVDQQLGNTSWRLQPAVRVQGSHYTSRGRDREDVHASGRLSLIRPFGGAELRFGLGYDRRESSEAIIADFSKWDLSLAGRMVWRF